MSLVTSKQGFAPATLDEAMRFSEMLAKSSMVPKQYQNKPEDVLVAVQWGRELGLAPLQALQNIACINGKPSVYGDAALALVQASSICEGIDEHIEGEGTSNPVAICIAKRRGRNPVTSKFSVEDAKRAGLWNKQGPWTQYPKRMLAMRARGFALRDAFPDVLKGLITVEEAQDYPAVQQPERDVTPITNPLDAIAAPVAVAPVAEVVQAVEEVVEEVEAEEVVHEVVEEITPVTHEIDMNAIWTLQIPGKDLQVYANYEDWSKAYADICDLVARAGRASVETRLQKLNALREANADVFDQMTTDQKLAQIASQAARRDHLSEVKNAAA